MGQSRLESAMLSTLLEHRALLRDLVARDLAQRYAGSALGSIWVLAQPVAMLALFYLVFARLMATRLGVGAGPADYAVYLCAGMVPWFAVQEALLRAGGVFRENAALVRRMAFPPLLPAAQVVLSTLLVTAAAAGALGVVLALAGRLPAAAPAAALAALAQLALLVAGVTLAVSALSVYLRDLPPALPLLATAWFWLTPVVYVPEVLPAPARALLALNPAVPVLDMARRAVGMAPALSGGAAWLAAGLPAATLAAGALLFARLSPDLADEL